MRHLLAEEVVGVGLDGQVDGSRPDVCGHHTYNLQDEPGTESHDPQY